MENILMEVIGKLKELSYNYNNSTFINDSIKLHKLKQMYEQQILKALKQGIEFEQRVNSKFVFYNTIDVIDYENVSNNEFEIYTEIRSYRFIYDAIITINGIPIAIIECNEEVDRGCLRLQKNISNINEIEELKTVQLLISISREDLKYKTNDKNSTWKNWDNSSKEKKDKIKEFLKKETLLNIIKNYIIDINGKKEIATYYQYYATKKILESKKEKNKVYLATGSGKTTTILFLLGALKQKAENMKIIIVVERLTQQQMIKEKIEDSMKFKAEIVETKLELEEKLNNVQTEIIITTIQKIKSYSKEYIGKAYIIADIAELYSEQVINRIKNEYFKNSILTQFTSHREIDGEYDYYYSDTQAIKDDTITKLLYIGKEKAEIQTIEEIAKDITNNFNKNYRREKKAIIITKKLECVKYIQEIKKIDKQKTIETISNLEEIQEDEFLEDIIRENGNLENYQNDNLYNFNEGKLEILVISSLEELKKITTSKVEVIYLTNEVSKTMIPIIFSIISKKEYRKERGLIVDYAKNKENLLNYAKEKEEQKVLPEINDMIHDTMRISMELYLTNRERIEKKLCTIEGLDTVNIFIELELFLDKVMKLLEETSFIFSSEYTLNLLNKKEQKDNKKRIKSYLEVIDKIMVITAKEVKEKKDIEEYCSIIKIDSFKFTPIEKEDILKYPNLEGIWTSLTEIQKAVAIKNRLKMYVGSELKIKEKLKEVEKKYKNKEINDHKYLIEIEKIRLKYISISKNKQIPKIIKKEKFTENMYNYIEDIKSKEKIQFSSEENKINIIIKIMNNIKEKIKVGWKDNYYLWKEIKLKIIETIYDAIEKNEMYILEETLDKLLEKIKENAYETLDYSNDTVKENLFYIKKKNAYAVLQIKDNNSFWVLENSTTVEGFSNNIGDNYINLAKELRKKGVIVNNQFVQEYEFKSVSAAANIILGRSSNGRIEWKDKDGKTYAQNEEERKWKNN